MITSQKNRITVLKKESERTSNFTFGFAMTSYKITSKFSLSLLEFVE